MTWFSFLLWISIKHSFKFKGFSLSYYLRMSTLTFVVLVLIAVIYNKTTREQWKYQTQAAITITIKYCCLLTIIIYIIQLIYSCMISQSYIKIVVVLFVFILLCVAGLKNRYLMDHRAQQQIGIVLHETTNVIISYFIAINTIISI